MGNSDVGCFLEMPGNLPKRIEATDSPGAFGKASLANSSKVFR